MNRKYCFPIVCLCYMLASCGPQQSNKHKMKDEALVADTSIVQTIEDAYIYGLPLVLMDITRRQMTDPSAGALYSPPNQFRHNADFPDASFKNVVRPNADTYYSIAWLDLSGEPVVLSLPDSKGRYYMMPMMDAYSNVFASPGTRTTGNSGGSYLISGPGWKGHIPAAMKHIQSPTNTVWIIGRTQVNGKEDGVKNVVPLQRQYKLLPLSAWGKTYAVPQTDSDPSTPKGDPNAIVKGMSLQEYLNYVNKLMDKNPPQTADSSVIKRFALFGIGAGKTFDANSLLEEAREAVNDIPKKVFAALDSQKVGPAKLINGWNLGRTVIGTYGTDYYSRASTAYFGLGANLREDAIYPSCYVDADGNPLNGNNKYMLHFEKGKTPPANAFWSLTMYDPDGYFVDNPINRYTLGDRSNLKVNEDKAIDIYIQKDNPGKDIEANWLPAPEGSFNLLLRVYWPKEEMINRRWNPPTVIKVNKDH